MPGRIWRRGLLAVATISPLRQNGLAAPCWRTLPTLLCWKVPFWRMLDWVNFQRPLHLPGCCSKPAQKAKLAKLRFWQSRLQRKITLRFCATARLAQVWARFPTG